MSSLALVMRSGRISSASIDLDISRRSMLLSSVGSGMSLSRVKFGCKKANPISKNINPRIVQRSSMIHEAADFFFMRAFIIGIPIFSRPHTHQIVRNIRAISVPHKMSLLPYHSNDIYPSISKIEKNQEVFDIFFYEGVRAKKFENRLDFTCKSIQYELYYFSNYSYLCSERKKKLEPSTAE